MFNPAVLRITNDDILAKFSAGVSNITAISLGSGYVVESAAPHLVMRAFKNLAAVSFATDFKFPQAEALKAAASAGPAATASAGGAKAAKAEVVEEAEEEADMDMGGMFGDDY